MNWLRAHATQLSALAAAAYAVVKAAVDWRANGTPIDPSTLGALVVAVMALFAHTSGGPPMRMP